MNLHSQRNSPVGLECSERSSLVRSNGPIFDPFLVLRIFNGFDVALSSCALIIDGMAIRKHVDYDPHKKEMIGYVDMGAGQEETIAKEALVIMAVGLCHRWKAPVAYYFTGGVNAATQKELVVASIEALYASGLAVHSLTMDGHATNVSMAKLFGCDLDASKQQMKTWFTMPGIGNRIFIVFDSCHMLKLLRNALHEYGVLISPNGMIRWDVFVKLHNLQDDIGLRLANKITKTHVEYENQKMKVSLRFISFTFLP